MLAEHLGVTKVIWLERGLVGDPTGGHVDNLACFARPGVVLALASRDASDDNHAALTDNLARLRSATDAQGRTLDVIEIEQPAAQRHADGRRLSASYVNFYLANGAVIMPMFDDRMDDPAYKAIAAAFPDRRVVQLDAADLVYGGGGIHCITQQQPAAPEPASGDRVSRFMTVLVPPAGLEPARPCGQQILSLPRLPVSPRGRVSGGGS